MFFRLGLLLILPLMIFAKENYYYSFINTDAKPISIRQTKEIIKGFQKLKNINILLREGKYLKAKNEIMFFRKDNKLKILDSDSILLASKIFLRTYSIIDAKRANALLQNALDSSKIYENDLANAYLLLVKANLRVKNIKKAKFYAKRVMSSFKNPYTIALGKVAFAETFVAKHDYDSAIRILYEGLIKTNDINVANLIGDELFNVYVLNKQRQKAYILMEQILKESNDFYIKHLNMANRKIRILQKSNMAEFAAKILKSLIKKAKYMDLKDRLNYQLAGVYMSMYDGTPKYLNKAKEIYRSFLAYAKQSKYEKKSQMYLDEILMREGSISPTMVAKRYKNSANMRQKALLQELLTYEKKKNFKEIVKSERVYRQISNQIARRFGYSSVQVIFDRVNYLRLKVLADSGKCEKINKFIPITSKRVFNILARNKTDFKNFFTCLNDYPKISSYKRIKLIFTVKDNMLAYRYLEKLAYKLDKIKDALKYSEAVHSLGTDEDKKEEFIDRFKVFLKTKNPRYIKDFFIYASKHEDYIKYNQNNPVIIDFYYQYYLYLLQNNEKVKARIILDQLYKKQIAFKARVYSPFVELELAQAEGNSKNYKKALIYLKQALSLKRSDKNLPKIYYDQAKYYGFLNESIKKKKAIKNCKALKGLDKNMYKKMCDML